MTIIERIKTFPEKVVYFDTETSNGQGSGSLDAFDPNSFFALLQFKIDGKIKVMRPWEGGLDFVKSLVAQEFVFVMHNSHFDALWMRVKHGIVLPLIFDTQTCSEKLNAGITEPDDATRFSQKALDYEDEFGDETLFGSDDYFGENEEESLTKKKHTFSHSLFSTVYRYTKEHIKLDKSMQLSDWTQELTPEQTKYAEDDVRYLDQVAENQIKFVEELGMVDTINLEMELIQAVIDMRFHGVKLDKELWVKEVETAKPELERLEAELNYEYGLQKSQNFDEMDSFFPDEVSRFSVRSVKEIADFFGLKKSNLLVLKEFSETPKGEAYQGLLKKTLQFRSLDKFVSTYGDSYMSTLHSDGKIHGQLEQARTATGRFSAAKPNLQNFDSDIFKRLLRPNEAGYVLISSDYSSVESRILADISEDRVFMDSVSTSDVHSSTARKLFGITENEPVPSELRKKAKGVSFGVPYGISAKGLLDRGFVKTLEEGKELLDNYYKVHSGISSYLSSQKSHAVKHQFSQGVYGCRRWYLKPKVFTEEKLKRMWISSVERQAQNFGIQNASAVVTKLALVSIQKWLKENNYGYLVLTIHDSIICCVKKEHVLTCTIKINEMMEEAGTKVLKKLKTPVDTDVGIYADYVCKITGKPFSVFSGVYLKDKKLIKRKCTNYHPELVKIVKSLKIKTDLTEWWKDFDKSSLSDFTKSALI